MKISDYWNFISNELGVPITINGSTATALIQGGTEKEYWMDKKITSATELHTGDVIVYDGKTYIINSEIVKDKTVYEAKMRQCEYKINFVIGGKVKSYDAYAYFDTLKIDENKYIDTSAGSVTVVIQSNSINNSAIDINLRFIKFHYAWKISGVDRSKTGLLIIHADKVDTSPNDDLINEIADANTVTHNYTVTITNKATNSVIMGKTLQYTAAATMDGQAVSNPSITWTSSDTSKATVNSTGLVTSVAVGTSIITASYQTATDTVTLAVQEAPHTYTVAINESVTSINAGSTQQYTAKATDNGSTVSNPTLTWTSSDTSVATVDSTGKVTGNKAGTFTLTCTYENVSATKDISIAAVVTPTYKWYYSNSDGSGKTYLTSSLSISSGDTYIVGIEKYINSNVASPNDDYTFVLTQGSTPSSAYTYSVRTQNTHEVNFTCNEGSDYPLSLKATSTQTNIESTLSINLSGW